MYWTKRISSQTAGETRVKLPTYSYHYSLLASGWIITLNGRPIDRALNEQEAQDYCARETTQAATQTVEAGKSE